MKGDNIMSILDKLNAEFEIKVINNVAYDMQDGENIIATNKQELVQFYIDSFKYKKECLFVDETEVKKHYDNVIKQLENLIT
jgi:hypothetical protein